MDFATIGVTLKLAALSTIVLILVSTPIAWWLSRTTSRARTAVAAVVTLPLFLPPTVLGFYLLVSLGPQGLIGKLTTFMGLGTLPFTFSGLVVGSVIYSLPFVVAPIQNAFSNVEQSILDAAATLGASPVQQFFGIALPLAKPGIVSGAVLGFAHTIGEFGIVLMIGGNIPGKTRVLSLAIYDHVEALEFTKAHLLSAGLVLFSFACLFVLYSNAAFGNFATARRPKA